MSNDAPLRPDQRALIESLGSNNAASAAVSLQCVIALRRSIPPAAMAGYEHLFNGAEFCLLVTHEIGCSLGDFVRYSGDFRGSYYGRVLILLIYESTRSMCSVLDRRFQADLSRVVSDDRLRARVREAHSAASRLHAKAKDDFREVRNGLIGHLDRDPEVRAQLLDYSHDHGRIADLAVEMLRIIDLISPALVQLTAHWQADPALRPLPQSPPPPA